MSIRQLACASQMVIILCYLTSDLWNRYVEHLRQISVFCILYSHESIQTFQSVEFRNFFYVLMTDFALNFLANVVLQTEIE